MNKRKIPSKLISIIFAVMMLSFSKNVNAQFRLSIGVEADLLRGNQISSKGLGFSLGEEFSTSEKTGLLGQLGYVFLLPEEDYSASYMVPLHVGFRVYLKSKQKGVYLQGLLGAHIISMKSKSVTDLHFSSSGEDAVLTRFSQSYGLGYVASEKIDIVFRYNYIFNILGTSNYVGIRVAYNLF